jgi:FAD/FMN-containing dehydrogenase
VPVRHLGRYIAGVRRAAEQAGVEIVAFGHAGDGHLHVNALVDTTVPGFEGRLRRLLDGVTDLLADLGGTLSGEHGDGRLRAPLLERIYGREIADLFRSVKRAFDPAGILNPGIVLAAPGAESVTDLKVGARATHIPQTTAERLQEMERRAGWGRSKLDLAKRGVRP